jgi:hypothetical protein
MDSFRNAHRGFRFAECCFAALCVVILLRACPVFAESMGLSNLQINGFGTVGSLATDISQPWSFRRDISEPAGSGGYANRAHLFVDSRLGVQANYSLGSKWEFVGQIVAKRQVSGTPLSQFVQWAFVSYKPLPDLTLNVGRRTQDIFLLANYRDVGFAYPWVRPNMEYYGGLPFSTVDGLDVAWTWRTGPVNWKSRTGYGFASNTSPAPPDDAAIKTHMDNAFSETLSAEFNGLTVKLSYQLAEATLTNFPRLDQLLDILPQVEPLLPPPQAAEDREYIDRLTLNHTLSRYVGLGVMYDRDAWLIHSEISRVNGGVTVINGWHGYSSVGYRIGPVTPFVMAGRVLPKRDITPPPSDWATPLAATLTPVLGASAANAAANQLQLAAFQSAQGSNLARMDQRSVSLGMRWDITAQTAMKLQWDYFHVYEDGSGLWGGNGGDGTTAFLGAAYANVFSVTLDFLF